MVTKEDLEDFFRKYFPQADFIIENIGGKSATIRKKIPQDHLRPGGTVSGPVLMEMADAALYMSPVLSHSLTPQQKLRRINMLRIGRTEEIVEIPPGKQV